MAFSDFFTNFQFILRWLHVLAGIVWIGHLYFFNFVNLVVQGAMDDSTKKLVNPQLMPRALWWFRWGAMVTFIVGMVLFSMIYMYTPGVGFGPSPVFRDETGLSGKAVWILLGMLLGTIMWFNVWFIIWPAQKKMLTGQVPPDQLPVVRKKAALASRINTYLSGPMLFGMLAANHYGAVNLLTIIVFTAIAVGCVWAAYLHSTKVGKLA